MWSLSSRGGNASVATKKKNFFAAFLRGNVYLRKKLDLQKREKKEQRKKNKIDKRRAICQILSIYVSGGGGGKTNSPNKNSK